MMGARIGSLSSEQEVMPAMLTFYLTLLLVGCFLVGLATARSLRTDHASKRRSSLGNGRLTGWQHLVVIAGVIAVVYGGVEMRHRFIGEWAYVVMLGGLLAARGLVTLVHDFRLRRARADELRTR